MITIQNEKNNHEQKKESIQSAKEIVSKQRAKTAGKISNDPTEISLFQQNKSNNLNEQRLKRNSFETYYSDTYHEASTMSSISGSKTMRNSQKLMSGQYNDNNKQYQLKKMVSRLLQNGEQQGKIKRMDFQQYKEYLHNIWVKNLDQYEQQDNIWWKNRLIPKSFLMQLYELENNTQEYYDYLEKMKQIENQYYKEVLTEQQKQAIQKKIKTKVIDLNNQIQHLKEIKEQVNQEGQLEEDGSSKAFRVTNFDRKFDFLGSIPEENTCEKPQQFESILMNRKPNSSIYQPKN